jgi:choline oxidase
VVVGGGSAGAVIARRLADTGAEVTLLEAGPSGEFDDRILDFTRVGALPAGLQDVMAVDVDGRWTTNLPQEPSIYDFNHPMESSAGGNPHWRYPTARVLGGGSSINGCVAFTPPSWVLREWEALGAEGWGPEAMEPYVRRVLERVHIEDGAQDNELGRDFLAAANHLGIPPAELGRADVVEGAGWLRSTVRGVERQSSAVSYLFPLAALPPNLDVETDTFASRVLLDDIGNAVGVETDRGVFHAREEVIVCAGSFGSPKLLMLSGIGPADELRQVGVHAHVDLPVGRGMMDHAFGFLSFEAARDVPHGGGFPVLFTDVAEGGYPELMLYLLTMRMDAWLVAAGYPTSERAFVMNPVVNHPRSRGTVRLRSSDPTDSPVIDPRLFSDAADHDIRVMCDGIELGRAIAYESGLARWIARELAPGADVHGVALADYVRKTSVTSSHSVGTCRMGSEDDPLAVVDSQLRVRGVGRLRVADASVFPWITTVNPNITVMTVAERCADMVLAGASAAVGAERT